MLRHERAIPARKHGAGRYKPPTPCTQGSIILTTQQLTGNSMTENFIVSDWFASRAKLDIQTFIIDGIEFELMTLSDELAGIFDTCETYNETLSMAANYGLAYIRRRVKEDAKRANAIHIVWVLKTPEIVFDPCVKFL